MPKSRGEAFGLEKYIKISQCQILNVFGKKSSASRQKCGLRILLERPNSWHHNFLKVLHLGSFGGNALWTSASSVKAERPDFGQFCIFIGPNASPLEVWP